MIKAFIDSSVLFTMCDSLKGASYELLQLAQQGYLKLITSQYVLKETSYSLVASKKLNAAEALENIKQLPIWEIVDIAPHEYLTALHTTPDPKDVSIVASAKKAEVSYLVSFDRKHLHLPSVEKYINAKAVTPDIVLKAVREANNR
ncbi:MAG: PIN domain-containing protein [Anaerolineae bacterium]|nr:PIN domain-containing protein [Anaerolineae bacterium]